MCRSQKQRRKDCTSQSTKFIGDEVHSKIQKIIDETYDRGYKYEGCLMACYSKEVFTRLYIQTTVANYHPSITAIDTTIDNLMSRGFVKIVQSKSIQYTKHYYVTKEGEFYLYDKFPDLSVQMTHILERHPTKVQPKTESYYADLLEGSVNNAEEAITKRCLYINLMLLDKNRRYGNSSLEPFGLFPSVHRASKIESRIEDKLKRMQNIFEEKGTEAYETRDYIEAVKDLTGYLMLYGIALENSDE